MTIKTGSGNKIRGSIKPFDVDEIIVPKEKILRSTRVLIPDTAFILRESLKMAIATRWRIALEEIERTDCIKLSGISQVSEQIILDSLREKSVDYVGTVECIIDYFMGRRNNVINLDPNSIDYKSNVSKKIATRAANDCLKLDAQYITKVKEKIENTNWAELDQAEKNHIVHQYKALGGGIKFINHYMKSYYTGLLKPISNDVLQSAIRIDPNVASYYHPKKDNPTIYVPKANKYYRSLASKEAAAFLVCSTFSF